VSGQLSLMFAPPRVVSTEPWSYSFGLPDLSGLARYAFLARWQGDPLETMARGGMSRASHRGAWVSRLGDREWWAARIEEHMRDGRARTWNALTVQIEGVNADAMFRCAADAGLWLLVARCRLGWTCEEGCVFFLHADAIDGGERIPSDESAIGADELDEAEAA
jgi:hypothetical protein